MRQGIFEIQSNRNLCTNVWEMVLQGDTGAISAPGQFVQLLLENHFLRRPISVCNVDGDMLTLIYKVVGHGTADMAAYLPGKKIDVLSGLGNGYDLALTGETPLLIGGGAGIPPLYYLARKLIEQGKKVAVIMGFNTAAEIFYQKEFENIGAKVIVATADGSFGIKGFAADAMRGLSYSSTCCCGPEPMLKAVYDASETSGQYSFEERMGCGFGACMGCTCETKYGHKRICKDGPVLRKEEIIW